jgi:hypothetical protein
MLAEEITTDLRSIRQQAVALAQKLRRVVTLPLNSKGINYGSISASPFGSVDYSPVEGVDPDLRVKPFFAEGSTISTREFVVGAMHKELGLEVNDPDLATASAGGRVVTRPAWCSMAGGTRSVRHRPPTLKPGSTKLILSLLTTWSSIF